MNAEKPPKPERKRRVYEPPVVTSEETFERDAVLGCGKITGSPVVACQVTPKIS